MLGAVKNVRPPVVDVCVKLKVRICPDSFGAPALMFVAKVGTICSPASSSDGAGLAAIKKLGTSLTAVTVMMNVNVVLVSEPPFVVPPLSVTVTLKVAVPFAFAAAWYVSVPVFGLMNGAVRNVRPPVVAS